MPVQQQQDRHEVTDQTQDAAKARTPHTLPPELFILIGGHLRDNNAIGTLALMAQASRDSCKHSQRIIYRHLQVTDAQLRAIVSPTTSASAMARAHTLTLELMTPLSSETAKMIKETYTTAPPFPNLQHLMLPSSVLRLLPHGPGPNANADIGGHDVTRAFNRQKEAICRLGPITTVRITNAAEEECVFTVIQPIIPTSMGLSAFLPRLSRMLPTIEEVTYETGMHADIIYPTTGVTTTYIDPCGCWLKYGSERMGLGLALAWVGETDKNKGKTKVVIKVNTAAKGCGCGCGHGEAQAQYEGSDPSLEEASTSIHAALQVDRDKLEKQWDAFHDQVVQYLRQAGGGVNSQVVRVNGKERLRCLDIVYE